MKIVTIEVIRLSKLPIVVLGFVLAVSRAAWADGGRQLVGAPPGLGPFGMAGKSVGGFSSVGSAALMDLVGREEDPITHAVSYNWQLVGGASNVGLTAKIWGTVTAIYHLPTGEQWFYVDDGSEVDSDLGDMGVLVYSDADVEYGEFVSVVGVVRVDQSFDSESRLVRTIETSSAADVRVIKDAPLPGRPFSDEFSLPTLKSTWAMFPGAGSVSVTSEPGWLALTTPLSTAAGSTYSPYMVQVAQGDWTLDVRVRCPEVQLGDQGYLDIFVSPVLPIDPWFRVSFVRYGRQAAILVGGPSQFIYYPAGDICYLRLRQSGSILYVTYSPDGGSYALEMPFPAAGRYVALCSELYHPAPVQIGQAYTAYVDYVRFTLPE